MIILNKSNRTSLYSKVYNCAPSTFSFLYQSSRRQAYTQRLYFEFEYTKKVKGQAFFYTLTYNDKSIPWYRVETDNGLFPLFRCFDYQHIQWLTHSVLDTTLHRHYGSRLRYFCACETGDGKGKRGLGSNPHYHLIFFIQPIINGGNPDYDNYKPISPKVFRSMVRDAWQGTHNYIPFEDAKFGIAREGDNLGLVDNIAALRYVSKYVLKDSTQLDWENQVFDFWTELLSNRGADNKALYYYYKYYSSSCFNESNSVPLHHFFYYLGLDKYNRWRHFTNDPDKSYFRFVTRYCDNLDVKVAATEFNRWFSEIYLPQEVLYQVRQFKNRYSGKTRCSKSLGEYGLKFVKSADTVPMFVLPKDNGYESQKVALYYYRKLYYETFRCDVSGNILYRLNTAGVNAHVTSLSLRKDKFIETLKESISIVYNQNLQQFDYLRKSPLLKQVNDDVLKKFSIYKFVYQYRAFHKDDFSCNLFDFVTYLREYKLFLLGDSYLFDWDYQTVYLKRLHNRNFKDYDTHEEIKPFLELFKFLDELLTHVSEYRSECAKSRFNEVARLRREHNQTKYNSLS